MVPTLSQLQNEAADKICARFSSITRHSFRGDITLTIPAEDLLAAMTYARDACGFDMLICVSSVDNLGQEPRYEVNYTITQAETGANLLVRCPAADPAPAVPSMVPVWRSANWLEREQYDLMGIEFTGHPDLRRIMMWEGYPYHPLRKDFPVMGKPTELPGVAFTEVAPTGGGPFTTKPGVLTAGEREPRARGGTQQLFPQQRAVVSSPPPSTVPPPPQAPDSLPPLPYATPPLRMPAHGSGLPAAAQQLQPALPHPEDNQAPCPDS